MTEQDKIAAAEPPLDCRVGRDIVSLLRARAARKWTDEANQSASLFGQAADEIERLRTAIQKTLDENGHLADGDVCTLILLKRALDAPNAPGNKPPLRAND